MLVQYLERLGRDAMRGLRLLRLAKEEGNDSIVVSADDVFLLLRLDQAETLRHPELAVRVDLAQQIIRPTDNSTERDRAVGGPNRDAPRLWQIDAAGDPRRRVQRHLHAHLSARRCTDGYGFDMCEICSVPDSKSSVSAGGEILLALFKVEDVCDFGAMVASNVVAFAEILRKESPILAVVFVGICPLQEHKVCELVPVDCAAGVGVDFHKELRELSFGKIAAEMGSDLFGEFIDV